MHHRGLRLTPLRSTLGGRVQCAAQIPPGSGTRRRHEQCEALSRATTARPHRVRRPPCAGSWRRTTKRGEGGVSYGGEQGSGSAAKQVAATPASSSTAMDRAIERELEERGGGREEEEEGRERERAKRGAMSERNKVSRSKQVLSLVVGQRSGYVRGRRCGLRPPSKSAVTTATIAGLQAQVKDKDEIISQIEKLISKQREEVAQIQEKLFKQKEEVTARLQSDMSSQLNELVNKKFMDMMFQFHRDLGAGH
ncbi:hypothetical protein Taro_024613 [Colocasia esculenta]|uniref:Uncharacterized protein n=1 Tax=Colocasia esculenta TaxID=4460 RepID=A0A843VF10_COLES|nr:hypothetical protein [Colocasia esculenta]